MTNSINRESLGFNFSAKENFQFLVDEYSFHLVKDESTLLCYESESVFVNIYHGRLSYELGFESGLKAKGVDSRYRLPIILRGLFGKVPDEQIVYQSSEMHGILSCLEKIAKLVRKHCGPILKGEELAFARIERASRDESRDLTETYTIGPVKAQAEEALINQNYQKVKSLYEQIKDNLSPIEIKRLEYARKNLQQGRN